MISHDDLTDDAPDTVPWAWLVFAVILAAVAWFATDGGKGSYPQPLSPPCPSAAETPASSAGVVSGAPEVSPSVEPRTPKNCQDGGA